MPPYCVTYDRPQSEEGTCPLQTGSGFVSGVHPSVAVSESFTFADLMRGAAVHPAGPLSKPRTLQPTRVHEAYSVPIQMLHCDRSNKTQWWRGPSGFSISVSQDIHSSYAASHAYELLQYMEHKIHSELFNVVVPLAGNAILTSSCRPAFHYRALDAHCRTTRDGNEEIALESHCDASDAARPRAARARQLANCGRSRERALFQVIKSANGDWGGRPATPAPVRAVRNEELKKNGHTPFIDKIFNLQNTQEFANYISQKDIRRTSEMYDDRTGKKLVVNLQKPRLVDSAIPSVFPNCPSYLSAPGHSRESLEEKRSRIENKNLELVLRESVRSHIEYEKKYVFKNFSEFLECLSKCEVNKEWTVINKGNIVIFAIISVHTIPEITASATFDQNLELKLFRNGIELKNS
ncbi:hypothetical protein EVAR_6363_1 [Eumeta japonica]|uniref:Uncharacterized protein n=1 Tax=Eumeta variegata TaxID=151549 RepID=A0A4C1TFU9_EUMVA|nr:hypothetical protein EVAR_6363_1 [Eumeta japonica]